MQHLELKRIVLIGASTGGPGQIQKIIKSLPVLQNTSLVIAQHMASGFMHSFSKTLQKISQNRVSIASNEEIMQSRKIYICEDDIRIKEEKNEIFFVKKPMQNHSYNPDINTLFESFVPVCHRLHVMSVLLTGIGEDGVIGCKKLGVEGSRCLTETKESAIIDGMPSRAREFVPNIEIYPIENIVKIISEFCE